MTLCCMARGSIDACISDEISPWEVAAGAILIAEAGGSVSLTDGLLFNPVKGNLVAACNETLHQKVVQLVREAEQTSINIA